MVPDVVSEAVKFITKPFSEVASVNVLLYVISSAAPAAIEVSASKAMVSVKSSKSKESAAIEAAQSCHSKSPVVDS